MKLQKVILLILALVMVGVGSSSAWAHGSRARVGVVIGGPLWWGWGYPPPYYGPPQVVVVPPPQPTVYIEQAQPAAPASQQYWHYCQSAKGYYPYVRECPEAWQKVLQQPEN